MSISRDFPHIKWEHKGVFLPKFKPNPNVPDEVKLAKENPKEHADKLRGDLANLRATRTSVIEERAIDNLPTPSEESILFKVPDGTDMDQLAYDLGVDLVAETSAGVLFAVTDSLDLNVLEEKLSSFSKTGKGASANISEVFIKADDPRKIKELLDDEVYKLWPFKDSDIYILDIGMQTALSAKKMSFTRKSSYKNLTEEEIKVKDVELRQNDMIAMSNRWDEASDKRYEELGQFIEHYNGELLTGYSNDELNQDESGIHYPDSIQVRVQMSGEGFRDLICNFPHLFEVVMPAEIDVASFDSVVEEDESFAVILSPSRDALPVCVIDSGIQEDHRLLAPAIDSEVSNCFIPEKENDDVADFVKPRGHGTRVAGAVLFQNEIPKEGEVVSKLWIRNARVLDNDNSLPLSLPPERYIEKVVDHNNSYKIKCKVYNHSINARRVCNSKRMSAWAAKIDELSHKDDILFIQSSGNLSNEKIKKVARGESEHLENLLKKNAKIANPAQSMHALTVGSVSKGVMQDSWCSFSSLKHESSAFSRTGYSPLWGIVKPEVVEVGGDYLYSADMSGRIKQDLTGVISPELVASTLYGQAYVSSEECGTSFATPKITHIAGLLQNMYPNASPQLFRALIVNSARWPQWCKERANLDESLRLVGYGIPSIERATENTNQRVTLITADACIIYSKEYHLYTIQLPESIRSAATEAKIRVDVTLAYTATPRRTRSSHRQYLENWLDWEPIRKGEDLEHFKLRMKREVNADNTTPFPWVIGDHNMTQNINETNRNKGSVQKDWFELEGYEIPETFAIAVRSHVGWNKKEGRGGGARYSLVVSFETTDTSLMVYNEIKLAIETEIESNVGVDDLFS